MGSLETQFYEISKSPNLLKLLDLSIWIRSDDQKLTECKTQSDTSFWTQIWASELWWNLLLLKLIKPWYVILTQTKNHSITTSFDHLNVPLKTQVWASIHWKQTSLTFELQTNVDQNEFWLLNTNNLNVLELCRWWVTITNLFI